MPRESSSTDLAAACDEAARLLGYGAKGEDPSFWLNMAESQVEEARKHLAAGEQEKAFAEFADLIAVSWTALRKMGKDPATFTEARVRTRILARADEVRAKYENGDGHRAEVSQ